LAARFCFNAPRNWRSCKQSGRYHQVARAATRRNTASVAPFDLQKATVAASSVATYHALTYCIDLSWE
jgi:hypothetical protein